MGPASHPDAPPFGGSPSAPRPAGVPLPPPPIDPPPMPQQPMPQQPMPPADSPGFGTPPSLGSGAAPGSAPPAPPPCPNCAFQSPPGFAFCGRCGTPLPAAAAPAAAAAVPTAPLPVPFPSAPEFGSAQEVGSAQTVFVGNARDLAMASTGAMDAVPDAPPQVPASVELGVAAPVVGSSGTAPGSGNGGPSPLPVSPGVPVRLVMLGPDGQPIGERVLAAGEAIDVGRDAGPPWDDDAYLDPRHATMRAAEAGVMIEDHASINGVFVKLTGRTELRSGDQFRVGQELLSYEELPEPTPTEDGTERMGSPNPGYWGRVSVLVDPAMASSAFAIAGEGLGIGREVGEITFPTDGYVSGRHCRIVGDDAGIYLEDLGSSNGTYMRVRTGQIVPFGSLVLIGQKLFQLDRA